MLLTLIVDEDFYFALLHHTHTGVSGAQIDTDDGAKVLCVIRRVDGLNGRQRREKKEKEGQEPKAQEG